MKEATAGFGRESERRGPERQGRCVDGRATRVAWPFLLYVGGLRDMYGLDVLVPDEQDRRIVHDVIYQELCVGVIADESREKYRRIIRSLADRGAEGILLGCTEIDPLVGPGDTPVPVFDTMSLHAQHAVNLALADGYPATPVGSVARTARDLADGERLPSDRVAYSTTGRYSNGRRPRPAITDRAAVTFVRGAGGSADTCRSPPQRRQSMPMDSVISRAIAVLE
jgi:Asp/Glu/Hydantoin racemase